MRVPRGNSIPFPARELAGGKAAHPCPIASCLCTFKRRFHTGSKAPSRPGDFHPEALTDPDVNLPIHPARTTLKGCRLPPSPASSSGYPLTHKVATRVTCPLPSTAITPFPRYYGAVRPWPALRYFRPRGATAWAFSLTIPGQVLKFRTKARMRVTPPVHRTPQDQ